MLPTDQRFLDLTEEQLDLIYEHYLIDTKPKSGNADPDFDNEEVESVDEHFVDPDFDDAWDDLEQVEQDDFSPIEFLPPQSMETQNPQQEIGGKNYIENEWEEV